MATAQSENVRAPTFYVGDGLNDAPAQMAATAGRAMGQNSEVMAEAADGVYLDTAPKKADEFMPISRRMRTLTLQSAIGGMVLSLIGLIFAATDHLSSVAGPSARKPSTQCRAQRAAGRGSAEGDLGPAGQMSRETIR